MRKRSASTQHSVGKINVTPLIDVVMCLIIFYLIVGRLATDRSIVLPSSSAGVVESGPTPLTIEIVAKEGGSGAFEITVGGALVDEGGLDRAVAAAAGKAVRSETDPGPPGPKPVQIRAGKETPYSALSPVLAACKRAGLTSVRLVTERGT